LNQNNNNKQPKTQQMTNAQSKINPYAHAVIYVIISPNCDQVYYGSTIKTLKNRFSKHKVKQSKCTSKKIIALGGAQIFEIESYPCTCLHELEDREAWWILNDWDGCVNENVPGAIRRAGGKSAYMKALNALPENKLRMKVYNDSPEHRSYCNESIPCHICGCFSLRKHMARHQRTKKCQNVLHGIQ